MPTAEEHDASGDEDPAGRRAFLAKVGLVGGAVWIAPTVLSLDAVAASSGPPPFFVPGSSATAFAGPSIANKSFTLTSGSLADPVQVGDLWVVYLSYDERGSVTVPSGWSSAVVTANSGGVFGPLYSIESVVLWRTLIAADITNGAASLTFNATGADLTYGGFRGSAVVYRGTNLLVDPEVNGTSQAGALGVSTVSATFPANAATGPNVVLRLGAARGYGGFSSISWAAAGSGTDRVNNGASNNGDRAQVINEQTSNDGAAQNRTINVGGTGNRSRTTATLVITNS